MQQRQEPDVTVRSKDSRPRRSIGVCSGMPTTRCPACAKPDPRLLDGMSHHAAVNYYRCDECGHVWTTPKDSTAVLNHVTPLAAKASLPPSDPGVRSDRRRAS